MNLLDEDTLWIFISGSDEDRFLDDIYFSISCLGKRSVKHQNILIFVDQPSGMGFVAAHGFPKGVSIHPTNEIQQILGARNNKKLVAVVTGHGNQKGIQATPNISPHTLVNIVKSLQIESGLIVLGQCYAGTFNFLEARSLKKEEAKSSIDICIIGATDLHVSISSLLCIPNSPDFVDLHPKNPWLANLFLFYFMFHVAFPNDTDGDGSISVIDTYKAAGIGANQHLISAKSQAFLEMHNILIQSDLGQNKGQQNLIGWLDQQAKQDYLANCEIVLTAQTPWILHANFARRLRL